MTTFRVGITMRVTYNEARAERYDLLDQAWVTFLSKADFVPVPIPNRLENPAFFVKQLALDALVLSGGNNISRHFITEDGKPASHLPVMDDLAPERDHTESLLLKESIHHVWPVIGVCRGAQAVNIFHGGTQSPIDQHVRTNHVLTRLEQSGVISQHIPEEVNSFHRYGVSCADLGPAMIPLAQSEDHTIEAFRHKDHPHFGFLWHPERYHDPRPKDIALFQTCVKGTK